MDILPARPLGYLLIASLTHQFNVDTHPTVTSGILVYHDRPVDNGILSKEAEIGVHVAVVPLVRALQAAVLSAKVADLILMITAYTCRGADGCINIEGVKVTASTQAAVFRGACPLWYGKLVHMEAACVTT